MEKIVIEGVPEVVFEDSHQSMQFEIVDESVPRLFVRLMSWEDSEMFHDKGVSMESDFAHPELKRILGKRLRVTIEVVGE